MTLFFQLTDCTWFKRSYFHDVGNFAVKSNCTRSEYPPNAIKYASSIATLRTSQYNLNNICARISVSFWVRFSERPVFSSDHNDLERFFLSVELYRPRGVTSTNVLPQAVLWGSEQSDFDGMEGDRWHNITATFTENDAFHIVFFAHHKNNCSDDTNNGVIFVDDVVTTAGKCLL